MRPRLGPVALASVVGALALTGATALGPTGSGLPPLPFGLPFELPWGAPRAAPAAVVPVGTAQVTRTDLVSRQQVNGTIGYAGQHQVVNRLGTAAAGTSSISQLQAAVEAAAAQLAAERTNLEDVTAAQQQHLAAAQARATAGAALLSAARDGGQPAPGAPALAPAAATARSQLESARLRLAQAAGGARPEEIAAALAQLDAATAALDVLLRPRPEDLAAARSRLERARIALQRLQDPRPEDIRSAEAALAAARTRLDVLLRPRPEDLAAAQGQVDQARTQLAGLADRPRTATPQELANAELAVRSAQVAYDRAVAEAGAAAGQSATARAVAEAAVQQALIALQQARNDLEARRSQGPTEWEVRQAQEAVGVAQAGLDRLRHPSPADVQAAQAAIAQALRDLEALRTPNPYDVRSAQEEVAQAQAELDLLTNPSPADVQAAQAAIAQARATLEGLRNRPDPYDVRLAQEEVARARATLDGAVAADRIALEAAQAAARGAINQARARVDAAEISLRSAETVLDAARRGPLVFTRLPAPGTVIERGQPLFEVDGRPVPLLYGERPAWRRLGQGVPPWPDVGALQLNLVALGLAGPELPTDGAFDDATAAAVRRWQGALGVPQTGAVEPGEALFFPGPLRIAAARVASGTPATPGAVVLDATSALRLVNVPLPVAMQSVVEAGDPVVITLPDGRTRTDGVVAEVGRVATAGSGTGGQAGQATIALSVTLLDQAAVGQLDQAPVNVAITTDSRSGVLAVPVNSLLALSEGGYAVAVRDGTSRTLVGVTIGLFDDRGLVEVSGAGLAEGMPVEVPR